MADMNQLAASSAADHAIGSAGQWVSEKVYASSKQLSAQTLTNWRYRDRLAGRSEAAPGYPIYRRFGRAVRYWMD
jgi:hypothetical protein